ncbi:MAG: cysteine synthase A [Muribaculaceae bacterium]|nr:cysteine synthase A [Muribaculaceae bacterium]
MLKIADTLADLIGNTPMLRLDRYAKVSGAEANLIAKLEYFNPGGSVKDRVAYAMVLNAERHGRLQPGGTIIEPTSGNTGIGLALVAASRGYKLILTMPDTMSAERRSLLKALGARLELTPGAKGMQGAIDRANELHKQIKGSVIMGQFDNPANPAAHVATTGPEIWRDTEGQVDIFVAGVGSGGTIAGIGRYLKQQNPKIRIIAVEPADSPVLSGGKPGPHKLQGIGAGFIPANYNPTVVDDIVLITTDEAVKAARTLADTEGLLCGISSGAALAAAVQIASRPENTGKNIVVLLPDTGERYLSTILFDTENYPLY